MWVGMRLGQKKDPSLNDGLVEFVMEAWMHGQGLFKSEDSMEQL